MVLCRQKGTFLIVKNEKLNIFNSILSRNGKEKRTSKWMSFSCGGDKRDRTADLLNAIQALSQLSYTPKLFSCLNRNK